MLRRDNHVRISEKKKCFRAVFPQTEANNKNKIYLSYLNKSSYMVI